MTKFSNNSLYFTTLYVTSSFVIASSVTYCENPANFSNSVEQRTVSYLFRHGVQYDGLEKLMEHGTWNMEHETWNIEHETWNIEHGTWNMELGTWNMEQVKRDKNIELGTWNMEHGTRNMEQRTWNKKQETKNKEQGVLNKEHGTWNTCLPGAVSYLFRHGVQSDRREKLIGLLEHLDRCPKLSVKQYLFYIFPYNVGCPPIIQSILSTQITGVNSCKKSENIL